MSSPEHTPIIRQLQHLPSVPTGNDELTTAQERVAEGACQVARALYWTRDAAKREPLREYNLTMAVQAVADAKTDLELAAQALERALRAQREGNAR